MRISFNETPPAGVVITLIIAFFVTGCAGTYGNLVSVGNYGMDVTLEDLIENHDKYHIYYSGPSLYSTPYAVLFDPKDDLKNIRTHEFWEPIVHPTILKRMIKAMVLEQEVNARLKVIKGNDHVFYGLIYTFDYAVIKQVEGDPDSVEVYPVNTPYYWNLRQFRGVGIY